MGKVYKGYELMKEIAKGKIRQETRFLDLTDKREQDYVPIKIIKNRIKDLKLSGGGNGKDEIENQVREFAIEILEELLGE